MNLKYFGFKLIILELVFQVGLVHSSSLQIIRHLLAKVFLFSLAVRRVLTLEKYHSQETKHYLLDFFTTELINLNFSINFWYHLTCSITISLEAVIRWLSNFYLVFALLKRLYMSLNFFGEVALGFGDGRLVIFLPRV